MATITQRDAACRQLATAIRMYFYDGDMAAIHTLAGAAREIFEKHCKKKNINRFFDYVQSTHNQPEKELWNIINKARNFFKHPSESLDDAIDLEDGDNKSMLFIACHDCAMLLGAEQPIEVQVFNIWWLATESPSDAEQDENKDSAEILAIIDATYPELRASSPAKQKQCGYQWLKNADSGALFYGKILMSLDDQIDEIGREVKAAENEIVMAIMFHETWKPTAYDESLHNRMGHSYATHSFQIVRLSLRREMLLALMRLWDSDKRAIRMTAIAHKLRDKDFFDALVSKRAKGIGLSPVGVKDAMREALEPKRNAAVDLVQKYCEGGIGYSAFEKIKTMRHEYLAHRQKTEKFETSAPNADATDQEIEDFYQDNLKLIQLLLSLVLGVAFDLAEAASMYRYYAANFWINARGERTEGHPNFKKPKN